MIEIDEKRLVECLNHVASTEEGRVVLSCLKEYCRFNGDIVVEGKPEDTYANATLRRAYLYLRNRIRVEHLKHIEFNYIRKANDRTDTKRTDRASTNKPTKRSKPA